MNWTFQYRAVPTQFEHFDCTLATEAVPADPNRQATRQRRTGSGEMDLLSDYSLNDAMRVKYWIAIAQDSQAVHAAHESLGPALVLFRHAEKDEQLEALQYVLPVKGWSGDTATLTDMQAVPEQDGVKVRDLFAYDDKLAMTAHDKTAIASTARATKQGKGETADAAIATSQSDHDLQARLASVRAAVDEAKAAGYALDAELQVVAQLQAQDEADEAREEIAMLREQANTWKEGVEFVSSFVTAVVYNLAGDLGDALDKVGVLAAMILGAMNDGRLATAQQKLAIAEKKYKTARVTEVANRVNGARSALHGRLNLVDAAKQDLKKSLAGRRKAYNGLGAAAGKQVDCPQASQRKITGILAAIPLVETVVARTQAVRRASETPKYRTHSGIGLGIAKFHQEPNVENYLRGVGELRWAHNTFEQEEQRWQKRLDQLLAVKSQIIGLRPGA